jgi:hypothetical protein
MIPANSTKYITFATAVAVTPAQTICYNTMPADLSISGYTGTVTKWQYSSDNFGSLWISAFCITTLTSAQMGALTATRYYRAVVTDWLCATVNSSAITVVVDPLSVGGTPTSAQTDMQWHFTRQDLTLAGYTGNVTKWQYSTDADFSAATDIAS